MKDRLLLHGIQCIVNTHKLCTAFLTAIMFIKYTILNPILQDLHLGRLQATAGGKIQSYLTSNPPYMRLVLVPGLISPLIE
ncbi:unknown [Clostridium clostridioforme CAG:132]|uniref:Uncharacterized protein n=1 Tax=[Clostridium] clostridioforme CAG:132 TaxID=1263065 RepID=R6JZ53_9FIRM|nr:unknown [[Clostridium] clostridioforme CAG:132]